MSDRDLCERFGTTLDEVEADAKLYERGDFSKMRFGKPIEGRPQPTMKSTSFKLFDFELAAIDRAAAAEGMSRSAFIRRACNDAVVVLTN